MNTLTSFVLCALLSLSVAAPPLSLNPTAACVAPWKESLGACLLFPDLSGTWEEAKSFCRANGGDLAVPKSPAEAASLLSVAQQKPHLFSSFWLGLRREANSTAFNDTNGRRPQWLPPWGRYWPREPISSSACIQFTPISSRTEVLMEDWPCSGRAVEVICTKRPSSPRPSPPSSQCSAPWESTPRPGLCLLFPGLLGNYEEGRRFCMAKDARLALPRNAEDAAVMLDFAKKKQKLGVWLGLRRWAGNSYFVDATHKVPTWTPPWYRNWYPLKSKYHECAGFSTTDKKMTLGAYPCVNAYHYVMCEKYT